MQPLGHAPAGQEQIRIEIEPPRPRNLRIQNANRTCRRASRICKNLPTLLFLPLVQVFEGAQRHDDLSAHLEIRRHAQFFQLRRIHTKRNRTDRAPVRGDLCAGRAVAARDAARKHSALVDERHTQPVELLFGNVIDAVAAREFPDAAVEFFELFQRIGVVETHHRRKMLARFDAFAWRPAHALRRRIRRDELRIRGFQPLKLLHHPVKLGVGDFRFIEHVLQILVLAEIIAQLFDLFGGLRALYHSASLKRTKRTFSIQCVSRPRNWMSMRSANTVLQENGQDDASIEVRDAVLILNPNAGGGRRVPQLDEARRIFRKAGIETELQSTTAPGEATGLARRAVEQLRHLVAVCGGDGTVNEAVNGLACSQVPLAVLPAGTANVLAKELSLPWNLPRAAEHIVRAKYRRIALGLAIPEESSGEPRYFLSVAGAGPDGALVAAVRPEVKLKSGIIAYWQEGFRQLTRYDFPRFRVTTGDTTIDATLVIVGRTKHYGGPFKITTQADLHRPA